MINKTEYHYLRAMTAIQTAIAAAEDINFDSSILKNELAKLNSEYNSAPHVIARKSKLG